MEPKILCYGETAIIKNAFHKKRYILAQRWSLSITIEHKASSANWVC